MGVGRWVFFPPVVRWLLSVCWCAHVSFARLSLASPHAPTRPAPPPPPSCPPPPISYFADRMASIAASGKWEPLRRDGMSAFPFDDMDDEEGGEGGMLAGAGGGGATACAADRDADAPCPLSPSTMSAATGCEAEEGEGGEDGAMGGAGCGVVVAPRCPSPIAPVVVAPKAKPPRVRAPKAPGKVGRRTTLGLKMALGGGELPPCPQAVFDPDYEFKPDPSLKDSAKAERYLSHVRATVDPRQEDFRAFVVLSECRAIVNFALLRVCSSLCAAARVSPRSTRDCCVACIRCFVVFGCGG